MTPEQQAAFIIAQAACAMAEIAGMQAENQVRSHRGETPAYNESSFQSVIEHNLVGHNAVISFFRS